MFIRVTNYWTDKVHYINLDYVVEAVENPGDHKHPVGTYLIFKEERGAGNGCILAVKEELPIVIAMMIQAGVMKS